MARSRSSFIRSSLQHLSGILGRRKKKPRRSSLFAPKRRYRAGFEWLESRAMLDGSPSFATIADQTVLGGAPTWLGISGSNSGGGPLIYTVSVSNPSLLQAIVPSGNKSLVLSTSGAETGVTGQMTFELLDNLVPNTTQHIEQLVNDGEFATNSSFYRIAYSGTDPFVIQGGPSNTTSSLGAMDDEFNPDLQFTSAGLLAMAKSTDDTGDSQVFVTAGPTRFLDFQHSIFGVLTAGDSVRQAIQNSNSSGDGAPPSTISISGAQIITDTINAALELKAARGASGTSDVTVTVTDAQNHTFSQTFHVTVTPDTQKPAPYLNKISPVSGVEGQPINVQLTATDVTGGTDFFDATKPSSETTNYTINVDHNTGVVTLTPPAGFTGTFHVQMSVRGTDTRSTADQSDTENVAVTVAAASLKTTNDTATVAENASATTIDVLANDTGESLTITAVGTPTAGGTVTITSDSHSISYTPAANFTGSDTFTYTVTDSHQATSTATVTVTVGGAASSTIGILSGFVYFDANNNGVFDSDELGIGGVTIALTGSKASDSTSVNQTTKTASDGSYSFSGLAPGSYTLKETQPTLVTDGKDTAGSLGGTVTNDQIALTLTATAGSTGNNFGELGRSVSTISIRDFFSSHSQNESFAAFDGSGNEQWHTLDGGVWEGFSAESFSDTAGTLKIQATNSQSQPVAASVSTTSPSVELVAQSGGSSLYRLMAQPDSLGFTTTTTTNSGTNQTPTASANSYSTNFNTSLTVPAPGVLSNDTDPQNKSLTAAVATQPANGTLSLAADGSFTYTPHSTFSGTDTFTYKASNGTSISDPATVTITVNPAIQPPTANADSYSTAFNTPLTIAAAGVLSNDTDPQNKSLTATVATQPANGTVSLAADGSFTYTPNSTFSGTDSFTYTVSNGTATSAAATVTIAVKPANQPPVATSDSFTATQATPLSISTPGVLANDTDQENSTLTAVLVSNASHGFVSLAANGSFTYTPESGFTGDDSFTYQASDGQLSSQVTTVKITVQPNQPPTATGDTFTATQDTPLSIAAPGVLANDTDPQSQPLTAVVATQPANGTVSMAADGSFTYTPSSGFTGSDTFTYTATNGTNTSGPATVTITVHPANQPPTAADDGFTATQDTPLSIAAPGVLANDTDPENSALTAVLVSNASNGNVSLAPDGSFTYTPNSGFTGEDSFTYKSSDGQLQSGIATVTITVSPADNGSGEALDPLAHDAALMSLLNGG
jgi:VCBS repeat-containing protein